MPSIISFVVLYQKFILFYSQQASKKVTDAKIAKDFQYVLKEFQKAQRVAAERESAYDPLIPLSR